MLCVCMGVCSRHRFEGHGAKRTFIEDLTVITLDVGLKGCNISEDHTTVDTAGGRKEGNRGQKEICENLQKSNLNEILTLKSI